MQIILSWLNGIMNATQSDETILTTLPCKVASKSFGSATTALQDSSTAGLLNLVIKLATSSVAVQRVLGGRLAGATPCRHSALTQLQSGTIARTKASPVTTLLRYIIVLGDPALSVVAGSRSSIYVQLQDATLEGNSAAVSNDHLLCHEGCR